jgi:beta-phosphoglucomutase
MGEAYAAIWDVDGTLVDTAELHFQAWKKVAAERRWPFSRDDFARTFGRRNPEIIHTLFDEGLSDREAAELADRKEALYRDEVLKGVALLPGVAALLDGLDRAGFDLGVGSSAPRANLDLILELTGTVKYFRAIVSSEDTQRGKPDPQVFLTAAERLGVEPVRCVVFEDATAGVEAATAGGMRCVAVRFVGHHPAEALRRAGADLVVETLENVSVGDVRELLNTR